MKTVTGTLALNMKGKGYLRQVGVEESIVIPQQFVSDALPGNTVEVELFARPNKWGETEGKVIKVIDRGASNYVAIVTDVKFNTVIARPDNQKMGCVFEIAPQPGTELVAGQKVQVQVDWSKTPKVTVTKNQTQEGYFNTEVSRIFYTRLLKVFGMQGDHEAEMESIVAAAGFDLEHSPAVEADAKLAVEKYGTLDADELSKRRDVRDVWTCTIDPVDAKDFDDALSYRDLGNGKVEIGIHIADVSHFVRPGSVLDTEARKRAFSVYLVDRTIPMLPEVLSNGSCSLNPNEDRFAFSAIFEMDAQANITSKWFGKTVIHSNKRFSYEEAQEVLDSKDKSVYPALFELEAYSKLFQADRRRKGAIDFENDEIKFRLDETGKPIAVYKKARIYTHHLVEEFMLLANREVAEFMFFNNAEGTRKLSGVYRVHDLPDSEKISELEIFVNALGLDFHPGKKIHARDIQKLLELTTGHPAEAIIKTATLRSMAKAAYKTVNIGHFGLAFEYYTHFTSPIRRYPDLSVHRIMQKILMKEPLSPDFLIALEDICDHSSAQEIKAAEAERASTRYKQVEYLSYRVGEEFDVTVSGVADFGIFLQEPESLAEGLVRLKDLGNDFFEVDKKTYTVTGQNTGKKITLGDKLHVRLRGVDLENKAVDFEVLSIKG